MLHDLAQQFPWPEKRPDLAPDLGPVWFLDEMVGGHTGAIVPAVPANAQVILELGSFMGRSTATFLRICPGATVIAVDTWKGSPEHLTNPELKDRLPVLYEQFLTNMWDHRNRVIPIRENTLDGMAWVAEANIKPDWIYVDADHTEEAVVKDIVTAIKLFPGSRIVGDDWFWPSVRAGVEKVAAQLGRQVQTQGTVWWFAQ